MISQIIFDAKTNSSTSILDPESEDDEAEEEGIQKVISNQLAVFVDREIDNYLLQFMRENIGNVKVLNSVHQAWFTLTECITPVKMVCFIYIRQVPDFREISLFCNAFKNVYPEGKDLIVLILISPSLEKATADALRQYKDDFNTLLELALTTTCCAGLHCEETLLKQYILPNDCGCSSTDQPMQYDDATHTIMAIFEAIGSFVRNRTINFNSVFHEKELVTAVNAHVESQLNADIIASFLYRGIPFTAKDGGCKVVSPFFNKPGLFIVKPDYQKYVNVSTLTGIDFNSPVNDTLNSIYEEYKEN